MKPTGYFVLGFAAASILWLIGLAVLNGELFRTFSNFSGH
jgi:arginine exporter protein ArgO